MRFALNPGATPTNLRWAGLFSRSSYDSLAIEYAPRTRAAQRVLKSTAVSGTTLYDAVVHERNAHAFNHRHRPAHPLAARRRHGVHGGRADSHPPGHRHRRGAAAGHPGPQPTSRVIRDRLHRGQSMFRYLALATCVVLAWEGGICFDHI